MSDTTRHRLDALRIALDRLQSDSEQYPRSVSHSQIPWTENRAPSKTGTSFSSEVESAIRKTGDSTVVVILLPNDSHQTNSFLEAIQRAASANAKFVALYQPSYSLTKWVVPPVIDSKAIYLTLPEEPGIALNAVARRIRDQLILNAPSETITPTSRVMIRNLVELQQSYWDWKNGDWEEKHLESARDKDFTVLVHRLQPYISFCQIFLDEKPEPSESLGLPLYEGDACGLIQTTSDVIFKLSITESPNSLSSFPTGKCLVEAVEKGWTPEQISKEVDIPSSTPQVLKSMVNLFLRVIGRRGGLDRYSPELNRYCDVFKLLA